MVSMIDLDENNPYNSNKIIIDYNEYKNLLKSIDEKDKKILELYDSLKLSNNTIVVFSNYGFPGDVKVLKDGENYTECFIRKYVYETPYKPYEWKLNIGNSKKVLSIMKEYIDLKLNSNWLTRKLKSKILKVLEL